MLVIELLKSVRVKDLLELGVLLVQVFVIQYILFGSSMSFRANRGPLQAEEFEVIDCLKKLWLLEELAGVAGKWAVLAIASCALNRWLR